MDNWIERQRIGVLAYALQVLPVGAVGSLAATRFERGRELLAHYVFDNAGAEPKQRRRFFASLPIQVLAVLQHTLEQGNKVGRRFKPVSLEVEKARELLHGGLDENTFGAVQVWTYHALIGQSESRRLAKLGRVLFGNSWRPFEDDAGVIETLAAPLETLRDPWAATQARCEAISKMADVFCHAQWWPQIENLLYQYQFAWPLTILPSSAEDRTLATSLPVAVDVFLKGSSKAVTLRPREGSFLVNGWYDNLRRALQAGRDLWRAKHGNCGDFREQVAHASALFNFETAEAVATPLHEMGFQKVSLDGGSGEAYFAQVVLNRLLGRSGLLASAVTGMIGERILNEDGEPGLNRQFLPPKGIKQKVAYVFQSGGAFERIVLPATLNPDIVLNLGVQQTAEVRYAGDLYTVADITQVNGWRQHHYVRCPDLAWGIHSNRRPGLLPLKDVRVEAVLSTLRENTQSSVITLDQTSGQVIASALWHVNTSMRLAIQPQPPPSLSWVFVRGFEWEKDLRFWRIIWSASGGSMAEFDQLARAMTADAAVEHLARALNRFEPDEQHPGHRAPDIVVILGSRALENIDSVVLNTAARPLLVPKVLEKLAPPGVLVGPFVRSFEALIGKTRIVVVPTEAQSVESDSFAIDELGARERGILEILSIFPWGFTQHTAELALAEFGPFVGNDLRERVLRPLVEKGYVRSGQGWYHLPPALIAKFLTADPISLADRHYKAGCALAPYATGIEVPSLALDTAFRPEHVHEAERHFSLAFRNAQAGGNRRLTGSLLKILGRLTRFAELPSWDLVQRLVQAQGLGFDAYQMAVELLERDKKNGIQIHPQYWLSAARAASQCARASGSNPARQGTYRDETRRFFQAAIVEARALAERELLLHALSAYAVYLWRQEPGAYGEADRVSREALDLIEREGADGRVARGEWFEIMADQETDHARAAEIYHLGLRFVVEWAQLWVKGLGAASLAHQGDVVAAIQERLARKAVADSERGRGWDLLGKCDAAFQRESRTASSHVQARWLAGRAIVGGHQEGVQENSAEAVEPC